MGNLENALAYYNKSYQYADRTKDLQTLMKNTTNMAVIYHSQTNISKAVEFFNIAMHLAKKISHMQGYMTICINLGILYQDKGYFQKASELFNETLSNARIYGAPYMESIALTNLGDISYYIGSYSDSVKILTEALNLSKTIEDIEGEAVNHIALAKVLLELDCLEEVLLHLESANGILSSLENDDILCDYYYFKVLYRLEINEISIASAIRKMG